MEQTPKQQVIELIKKSTKVLVLGCSGPTGDTVSSIMALSAVLRKLDKEVTAVVSDHYPENLGFLPHKNLIQNSVNLNADFVISVSIKNKPIGKLSYNKTDDALNIILTPGKEKLTAADVTFSEATNYEIIIILDTPDIDKIDRLYDQYVDTFYKVPVINIDHHAGNENYGTVNLVDLTATSTAEILTALVDGLGANLLDADIATCLMTGIIDDTASFKNVNTTPKSFTVSAQLLAAGAKQQEIINNLYKSKSINTLKLWGKILDGLTLEENCVWATVSHDEYAGLESSMEDIYGVINELLATIPDANTVIIFVEDNPDETRIIIRSKKDGNASEMSRVFGVLGSKSEAVLQLMGKPEDIARKFFDRVKGKKPASAKEVSEKKEVSLEKEDSVTFLPKTEPAKMPEKTVKKSSNVFSDEDEDEDGTVDFSNNTGTTKRDDIGVWNAE